jgi:predicted O-linked N-acetylglucosamine transferase (SPINDLY family)
MILSKLIADASALSAGGQPQEAIALYEQWLRADPPQRQSAVARFNLAVLLTEQQRFADAEKQLRLAIEESPKFPQAFYNLGLNLEKQSRPEEAIVSWLQVTSLLKSSKKPEDTDLVVQAYNQIGRLQEQLKNYNEAEFALRKSIELRQHQPDAIQHLVHIRQKKCEWQTLESAEGIGKAAQLAYISPLASLAYSDSPIQQQLSALSFHLRKYPYAYKGVSADQPIRKVAGNAKIRIGFVSGDLCTHAVGLLLPLFLGGIDKNYFELIAFDFSPEDGSQTRKTLKATFTEFYSIKGVTDEQAAELIKSKQVDVLFDMHGLSSGARPKIFAMRPCNIQVAWLGYIGTTSFPWIDYILVDRVAFHSALSQNFSERPLFLEGSFIPINQTASPKPKNFEYKKNAVVLGCLNNIYKINNELFELWMDILKETSNTRLILLDDNKATTGSLLEAVGNYGIEPHRVSFFKRSTFANYKEELRKIDIYLDTYPYCAGSTARDVINAGTLMVTMKGGTLVSRMGASILSEINLAALIADNFLEYKNLLLELCLNHGFLCSKQVKIESGLEGLDKILYKNVSSFQGVMRSIL